MLKNRAENDRYEQGSEDCSRGKIYYLPTYGSSESTNHVMSILVSLRLKFGSVRATGVHACISGERLCPEFNMPLRDRVGRVLAKQCEC